MCAKYGLEGLAHLTQKSDDAIVMCTDMIREKCSKYDLVFLTTKKDAAVRMMALQRVEGVIRLALGGEVPLHLDYTQLADHLVGKLAPRAAASVISADAVTPASVSTGMSSSLLPVEAELHSEVQDLRKRLKEQNKLLEEQNKMLARMQEQINKLALKDSDHNAFCGSGLVLALRDSKQSETRTVQKDLEKLIIQLQLQLEELRNACIATNTLLEAPRNDDHARAELFSPTSPPEEDWT
jgi:hypothetical protein